MYCIIIRPYFSPHRAEKCMSLIHMALRRYKQLREFAYAYDSSSTLFTNEPLDLKEVCNENEINLSLLGVKGPDNFRINDVLLRLLFLLYRKNFEEFGWFWVK